MGHAQETRLALFTGWRGTLVALFTLGMVATGCAEVLAMAERFGMFGNDRAGRIGIGYDLVPQAPGWVAINRIDPGSGAEHAGLRVGDRVRAADPLLLSSDAPPGVTTTLFLHRAGGDRRVQVVYQRFVPPDQHVWLAIWFTVVGGSAFALVLGTLVVWRGWGNGPALALGLGLIGSVNTETLPWWMLESPLTPLGLAAIAALDCCLIGMLVFPVVLYAAKVAAVPRGWWIATGLAAGLATLCQFVVTLQRWWAWPAPSPTRIVWIVSLVTSVAFDCWWSWRGRREAVGAERSRFSVLLFAFCLNLVGGLLWVANNGDWFGAAARPWIGGASIAFIDALFPLALSYAVLRHRVIDLGFAFNRTLVYGSVSAILLCSFGLIEWGIEHALPEAWVKASAWIDAGAAVLVYLAFHRVHGAVEHRVEQVFFRQWQANEDALRRFVGSAAYFEDARALARAFADELSRFGGDARVAIYRRNEGVLDRVGGTWDAAPRHFREDDPAFALMRAERAPLDLEATHTDLPGVLALPMLDHGVLAGLVLMDLKGNGALYRPDEVALLGWATHEVGLALAALHAGLIETENRLLKAQLARIGSIIGDRLDRVGA